MPVKTTESNQPPVRAGGVVVAVGAGVAWLQADNSMLANNTTLNTMLIFLFILISPPKKDLGTTEIPFSVSQR
jgi:hypothetical protein